MVEHLPDFAEMERGEMRELVRPSKPLRQRTREEEEHTVEAWARMSHRAAAVAPGGVIGGSGSRGK